MEAKEFTKQELEFVKTAAQFFENPGLFVKGMNLLTTPIGMAQSNLPAFARKQLARASRYAIERALVLSIKTVSTQAPGLGLAEAQQKSQSTGRLHSSLASFVGGCGGFLGLATLPVELPLATIIMLRSIAEIARQNGADLNSPEAKLDCLYILSLEGGMTQEDSPDSEYYTSRVAFSELLSRASAFLAGYSAKDIVVALENRTAPALIRLVAEIAAKFEVQLTRKLLAQVTPLLGAVGGAGLNLMFSNYYNACARFHFGLRSLEKSHGIDKTRAQFEKFRAQGLKKSTL
jgi:hypothetical protein